LTDQVGIEPKTTRPFGQRFLDRLEGAYQLIAFDEDKLVVVLR
jgi:hypothetical protein